MSDAKLHLDGAITVRRDTPIIQEPTLITRRAQYAIRPSNKAWHCYPRPGQTYAELLAEYGKEKMAYAILHMPEEK
jgi:hypothetical protein